MRLKTIIIFIITLTSGILITSCNKYLDKKPRQSLVVPQTLTDLQAILDNNSMINRMGTSGLATLIDDDYYITTETWQSRSPDERANYIWDKDASYLESWQNPYIRPIYYANLVLDILPDIKIEGGATQSEWNIIKGSALFYRSFAFMQLAQLYCRPYSTSASTDMGIVLKLTADINSPVSRSTVEQTYKRIITDLKEAADLLPKITATNMRPGKAAAYGALARTYLSMSDYTNAGIYADLSLKEKDNLMDYNTAAYPFEMSNSETLFYNFPQLSSMLFPGSAFIDSNLYKSYANNDLRKSLFFSDNGDGTYTFNGSYSGIAPFVPFDGITTDEVYLIRAECYAREGNVPKAMEYLNKLLEKRWVSGSFVPYTAATADEAKQKVLAERRKELVYRGLRWSDIRRLNLEGANITLKRVIDGTSYMLQPNDLRSVLLIPREVIKFNAIQQNPR